MSEFTDLSRVVYVPSMNMENYVRHMKENKYDIGIAVLNQIILMSESILTNLSSIHDMEYAVFIRIVCHFN